MNKFMGKLLKHLKTIRTHRKFVRQMCWKMGLIWQGLVHDLSKYSHEELKMCKYWTGVGSPHQACRNAIGYSPSWIHHYHKNKHHWEYWLDDNEEGQMVGIKMPYKYVIESFCDMVGASKAYGGKNWKPDSVWNYWVTKCKGKRIMHPTSEYLIEKLLWNYKEMGEKAFLDWYKYCNKSYLQKAYADDSIVKE